VTKKRLSIILRINTQTYTTERTKFSVLRVSTVKILPTNLEGAFIIEIEPQGDTRGFFARTFCRDEFTARQLCGEFIQCSTSMNFQRGTIRGMYYQKQPHGEVKLVRCTRGAIYDVIVDLRHNSITYCRWTSVELTSENRRMLYVPEGFAHGFQTLEDDSEVFYQISTKYQPHSAQGIRWNDPTINIFWPFNDPIISDRDASFKNFNP
jgi:dTDP-4-dehydrorhamnose 3,5-epimerase